jgi:hypothetical protein
VHGVPVWLLALVAAALAPTILRLYAKRIEERRRRRTERAMEEAIARERTEGR